MAATRIAVFTVLLLAAAVMQLAVLPWLPFPFGTPDLVLALVVALALTAGSRAGALGGFGAGLLLDLAPPADHPVGQWALVLCLVGYLAGLLSREARDSTVVALLTAGAAALVTPAAFTSVAALLGDPRARWPALGGMLLGEVLYVVLLTPLALHLTAAWVAERRP